MADLDQIFPDHGDAEHHDLTYVPGESLQFDGPAKYKLVSLRIVNILDSENQIFRELSQDVQNEEYDIVVRGEYTTVFPYNSTLETPALAYEIRGHNEGEASVALAVGFLTTEAEPKEETHAQENESGEATGDREPGSEENRGESSEGYQS